MTKDDESQIEKRLNRARELKEEIASVTEGADMLKDLLTGGKGSISVKLQMFDRAYRTACITYDDMLNDIGRLVLGKVRDKLLKLEEEYKAL